MSLGVSEVSEQANEWAQRSSAQQANEWAVQVNERINEQVA